MIFGVLLIACGIMIMLYPPLLSIIVGSIVILGGLILCVVSYRFKKMSRRIEDPFLDFFVKF